MAVLFASAELARAGLACAGMACAAGAGCAAWLAVEKARCQARYVRCVRAGGDEARMRARADPASSGENALDALALTYAVDLSQRFSLGHGRHFLPQRFVRAKWIEHHARVAGLDGMVSAEGFCEVRFRLAVAGGALGLVAGLPLSGELAVLLCGMGVAAGWRLLTAAIRRRAQHRAQEMERHLPEMLDVVALGMRSGLSFDRSIELYAQHFDTLLARAFGMAQRQWSCGLVRRDDALRGVADSYSSPLLRRVVEGMVRSLRFGSSMAEGLEAAAREARTSYRARRQEQVAKAPVKMMVPTGALILPAMLIMVLGPVLLELMEGF